MLGCVGRTSRSSSARPAALPSKRRLMATAPAPGAGLAAQQQIKGALQAALKEKMKGLLRNQALGSGMVDDNIGGGFKLLKAAKLDPGQETAILRTCKLRAELSGQQDSKPTYAQIAAELRTMIQVDELDGTDVGQ